MNETAADVLCFLQEKKLNLVRDLVFVEGCGKINDETREKLGFLNMTCNSFAGHDEVGGFQDRASRLNTISEAMDSTGKWLEVLLTKNLLYFHTFKPVYLTTFYMLCFCSLSASGCI
jgi:hypothetical protein